MVYGLGNAIAQQDPLIDELYEGNAATVTFTTDPEDRVRVHILGYTPTLTTTYGARPMPYLNAVQALDDPQWGYLHDRLESAVASVREDVGSLGAFRSRAVIRAPTP